MCDTSSSQEQDRDLVIRRQKRVYVGIRLIYIHKGNHAIQRNGGMSITEYCSSGISCLNGRMRKSLKKRSSNKSMCSTGINYCVNRKSSNSYWYNNEWWMNIMKGGVTITNLLFFLGQDGQ